MHQQMDLLLTLAEGTSHQVGRSFLDNLSGALRDAMDVSMVMLTERIGGPQGIRARSVVALANGEPMQDFEYDLKGTPCELVYNGKRICVTNDLSHHFEVTLPGKVSYVGVPLYADGKQENVLGHLSVLSDAPLSDPTLAETVLRIYGKRAEAEIQRLLFERERDQLLEDQKALNQRLSDNYERVHKANEYKTQVLGMVAHDLRNPIGQVLGFADLGSLALERNYQGKEGKVKEYLNLIESVGRTMLEQVERILDSAKEEADELGLHISRIDLRDVAIRAIRMNREAAERKNITVLYEGADSIPVDVDEGLIQDALDNLLSNAIKYSPPETTVRVSANVDPEREVAALSVMDQGLGLDEKDIAKAFGRFQRLSAAPTGGEESAGLGLYNVRLIAERHGGSATVASPGKNQGATFTIEWPGFVNV